MVIESAIREKAGLFALAWGWLKALLGKSKANIFKVAESIRKFGQEDPRRVIHSVKVGVSLTLVSFLYYSRRLYDSFGVAGMWAVLTAVVVSEFTVGGTLSKSLNRGFATLLAGALGLGAQNLAILFGEKGEPFVLGILVFLLAAASTFTRFFPAIKARHDYGVQIFILTFSLVSVSGYRVAELLELANERLSTVLIGGATCIVVSTCIRPVWAGEDLHKFVASNIEKLANYLEGFGGEYFKCTKDGGTIAASNDDKSFLQRYKTVLNTQSTEESMANLARWEPRHGRFGFRHPWKQYLKIGALTRQCAYQIEALNSCINSNIQVPNEFRNKIQESCTKICKESGKALKLLASAIKTMTDPSSAIVHVDNSKNAIKDLKSALKTSSLEHANLLAIAPDVKVVSILIEIVNCVEKLSESVYQLSNLAHFRSLEPTVSPEKPQLRHLGSTKPVLDCDGDHVIIIVPEKSTDSPENSNPQEPKSGQPVEV